MIQARVEIRNYFVSSHFIRELIYSSLHFYRLVSVLEFSQQEGVSAF